MSRERDKYITAKNWLTHYALACGYMESVKTNTRDISLTLWHDGGACFHVRLHCHSTANRIFWDSFDTLPEARKAFSAACREWCLVRRQPTMRGYKG
jgi:hypothetical protein